MKQRYSIDWYSCYDFTNGINNSLLYKLPIPFFATEDFRVDFVKVTLVLDVC